MYDYTVNWHIFKSGLFIDVWMHVVHHTNKWRLDVSHGVQDFQQYLNIYIFFRSRFSLFSLWSGNILHTEVTVIQNTNTVSVWGQFDSVWKNAVRRIRVGSCQEWMCVMCTIITLWHLKERLNFWWRLAGSQYMNYQPDTSVLRALRSQSLNRTWGLISS